MACRSSNVARTATFKLEHLNYTIYNTTNQVIANPEMSLVTSPFASGGCHPALHESEDRLITPNQQTSPNPLGQRGCKIRKVCTEESHIIWPKKMLIESALELVFPNRWWGFQSPVGREQASVVDQHGDVLLISFNMMMSKWNDIYDVLLI